MLGKHLLHYQVESHLGTGGMGEVYCARDTKLGRTVAIKVLPEVFAQDFERVARFEREARLLASLNHANIAALYGLESADGRRFLVMELVEGETLSQRIHAGRMLPEEALGLARQICEALEAAHEKGVVHRDLKPANVKITPDGKVKVLDFGLAKAVEEGTQASLLNSPTLSIAATHAGVILGTAAYMSPEQAKGVATDHRSDIFSFGCVLYEMLTGRQSFQGDTMTEVIASVLKTDPDVTLLPPNLHPRLVEVIRRCLAKDPKRRWHAVADVRVELDALLADPQGLTLTPGNEIDARRFWPRALPLAAAAAVAGAALVATAAWLLRPASELQVSRFAIVLPEEQRLTRAGRPNITMSADGRNIVYVADGQLYVRGIGDIDPRAVPGTNQDVNSPVFSPDGQWIAFYAVPESKLKKVSITGGASVTIADFANPYGVSWGPDDQILLGAGAQGIARVSANGGTPETVVTVDPGSLAHGPQMLPDGDHVLFTLAASASPNGWDEAQIVVQSLSTGRRTVVLKGGSDARYVPTGHIVYALGANLMAVHFDLARLEAGGGPVPILEGVMRANGINTGSAFAAFSETGSLVYFSGENVELAGNRTLAVIDRKGALSPLPFASAVFIDPRLSPDGRHLLVRVDDESSAQTLWIYDMSGKVAPRRLTFTLNSVSPAWTPDGRRVMFVSTGGGDGTGIFSQAADGSGAAQALATSDPIQPLGDLVLSPDGKTLIYRDGRGADIWMIPMSGEPKPQLLIAAATGQFQASFSPDGKWIAYTSVEAGAPMVYVQPFPPTGAKYQVSTVASRGPLWSRNGRQLFYIENLPLNIGRLMVIDVQTESGFGVVGKPQPIFDGVERLAGSWPYAVIDENRFLVVVRGEDGTAAGESRAQEIRVTLNWFEDLKQRVPVD